MPVCTYSNPLAAKFVVSHGSSTSLIRWRYGPQITASGRAGRGIPNGVTRLLLLLLPLTLYKSDDR
jgi:hypothetical protein